MKVYFDVQEMYYLPQYIPILSELNKKGVSVTFILYGDASQLPLVLAQASKNKQFKVCWVKDQCQALSLYQADKPNWLIIGNIFPNVDKLAKVTKTALVSHGIGPKSCYYTVSDTPTDVRFVEGPYRTKRLKEMYPGRTFIDTGYAKLDPAINGELSFLKPSDFGLDDDKKTLLYAPTFYPSSIERFSKSFPKDFEQYNIILKPHFFSLTSPKYKKQKKLLELWAKYDNVYLAGAGESNILPFMVVSDVLISDASSTLFEFAALNKPVIWCDFLKLRWAYRGLLKFRFKKRMDQDLYKYADIAAHAGSYKALKDVVLQQASNPEEFASQRAKYTLSLAGLVDGKASERIVHYMLNEQVI